MPLALYYVLRGGDGWIVRFGDRDYGHLTLTAAVRAAIAAARDSARKGHEAQVLVQFPDDRWTVLWASEDDLNAAEKSVPAEAGVD